MDPDPAPALTWIRIKSESRSATSDLQEEGRKWHSSLFNQNAESSSTAVKGFVYKNILPCLTVSLEHYTHV